MKRPPIEVALPEIEAPSNQTIDHRIEHALTTMSISEIMELLWEIEAILRANGHPKDKKFLN